MKRRNFCQNVVATGLVSVLPGCKAGSDDGGTARTIAALTGDGQEIDIEFAAIDELAGELSGQLLLATDADYASAKRVWNGMFDHKRPAVVIQCASTNDVVHAVNFARERNLLVAVKGGGHSLPGKSTCDGGMMIDLSTMQSTDLDIEGRTLRVDGGALLGHIDSATHPHGLGTTTGIVSHTGVGGFTLGGGYGRTDRFMGLAVDNVRAATIVTASGDVIRASNDDDRELFWAIRGGGGNFGIATEFVYGLHPFNPTIYGGVVTFDLTEELLVLYSELAAELPNEASIEPAAYVAEDGARLLDIEVCYCGELATAETALAPLLSLAKPLAVDLGALEYKTMQTGADITLGHGRHYYLKSGLLTGVSAGLAEVIVDHMSREQPVGSWFQHLGGAPMQVAPDDMAYSHRDARLNLGIMFSSDDPAAMDSAITKARAFYKDAEQYMIGFYTNLNDETTTRTHRNYGDNYARLVAAKNRYDPTNLFRLNANIEPA
jgi:FAD/FMN-containing dehydrogenase